MCYYSIYRNSWYFFPVIFCEGMVLLIYGTVSLDRLACCEKNFSSFSVFIHCGIWLYFALRTVKRELYVQLSSASLLIAGDNPLLYEPFRVTAADIALLSNILH